MHVTVDIPEQKSTLDSAVLKQFSGIQKALVKLLDSQQDGKKSMQKMMMDCMENNSDSLIEAMDRMMALMQKALSGNKPDMKSMASMEKMEDAMTALMKKMDKVQMKSSAHGSGATTVVSPKVTVTIPTALTSRLDKLQDVLMQGLKKSRSRTFGSNY